MEVARHSAWVLILTAVIRVHCQAADPSPFVHSPSSLVFPARIEGRFTRAPVPTEARDAKQLTIDYRLSSGEVVRVTVYPAPADAKGPKTLDGGPRTDASAAFMTEFDRAKNSLAAEDSTARIVDQMRFHAALHKRGPIGMKATLTGKTMNQGLLLCERNGYFVRFTVTYPKDRHLQIGMTYTDVANFILWPELKPVP